ncbi:hypothetical protein [Enterococcus malodoratus]|uniref:hypothetical protein n=1 Tax=Enterococcus malodoratus TaxID=71451 RepID=UPI0039AFB32E
MNYSSERYKAECKNLQASKASFIILNDEIKKHIRLNEEGKVNCILPFLLLNTSMIIENYLYKILNSKHLPYSVRCNVYDERSFVKKWKILITKCVTNQYGCEIEDLEFTDRKKYQEILLFVDEIKTLYELRNKFAHGELRRGFNNDRSEINNDKTREILCVSYFDILRAKKSFDAISDLLIYTVESPKSFRKYFDKHYARFEKLKDTYDNSNYEAYKKELMFRYKNGKKIRNLD